MGRARSAKPSKGEQGTGSPLLGAAGSPALPVTETLPPLAFNCYSGVSGLEWSVHN